MGNSSDQVEVTFNGIKIEGFIDGTFIKVERDETVPDNVETVDSDADTSISPVNIVPQGNYQPIYNGLEPSKRYRCINEACPDRPSKTEPSTCYTCGELMSEVKNGSAY